MKGCSWLGVGSGHLPQHLFRVVMKLAQLADRAARGANPALQAMHVHVCQRALAQTWRHESANRGGWAGGKGAPLKVGIKCADSRANSNSGS